MQGVGSYLTSIPTELGREVLQALRFFSSAGLGVGFKTKNCGFFSTVAGKPKFNTHVYSYKENRTMDTQAPHLELRRLSTKTKLQSTFGRRLRPLGGLGCSREPWVELAAFRPNDSSKGCCLQGLHLESRRSAWSG